MKPEIIRTLQEADAPVSGESLARAARISRVAVWKHVQSLRQMGYPIGSGPAGYWLDQVPDLLYPWEFPGREHLIRHFPETGSTMDTARELAQDGCPAMTVVVAERQTAGRGRLARPWHSDAGGLYLTVVFRPDLPPAQAHLVLFAASTAICETLRRLFDINAAVKWPNDILVDDRKLVGVLSEIHIQGDRVEYLNLGVGINVNNHPETLEPRATSIRALMGRPVLRKPLFQGILDAMENTLTGLDTANVMGRWKALACTLGRTVRIEAGSRVMEGVAVDVDELGSLVIRKSDGSTEPVSFGDCLHQDFKQEIKE